MPRITSASREACCEHSWGSEGRWQVPAGLWEPGKPVSGCAIQAAQRPVYPREAPAPHSGSRFSFERSFGFIQTVIRDPGNAAAGRHRGPVPVVRSWGRKPGWPHGSHSRGRGGPEPQPLARRAGGHKCRIQFSLPCLLPEEVQPRSFPLVIGLN